MRMPTDIITGRAYAIVVAAVAIVTGWSILGGLAAAQCFDYGTDPTSPPVLGSVSVQYSARKVAVSGNRAYVANGVGLVVVDITDASNPVIVDSVDTPGQRPACCRKGSGVSSEYANTS